MLERHLEQNAVVQRLSRPTDLPNLEKPNGQTNGQKMSFQSLYNSKSPLAWQIQHRGYKKINIKNQLCYVK